MVLQEYLDLGHMTAVTEKVTEESGFYLPHHTVMKERSLTTALRVVFDASAKTSTGISLNDSLLVDPTLQSDLFTLLLRFRKHSVVITGDIEKMYRQIMVRPEDRKYQRILWWNSDGLEQTYELNTVTFGIASAPYLAIRCIHQLAEDEQHNFPQASRVLKDDLYVDDAITGADSIEEAIVLRDQLSKVLERGNFKIRQWASNVPELLEDLPTESINRHLVLSDSPTIKTLGVEWNSRNDTIVYTVQPYAQSVSVTKRIMLAEISKIFDPLGLLAPVIIKAKILMQKLWILKLNWDESLPLDLHTAWVNYYQQLQLLNNVSFERRAILESPICIELHGFCDASEQAYGACLYLRSTDHQGNIHTALLCAKSRVAPVKTLSIPRLELCGASLLTDLICTIKQALQLKLNRVVYWTDSTIVLYWLQSQSRTLQTFVANRVADIQSKTDVNNWRHVRTHDNPADLLSRGQLPEEFQQPSLWLKGPSRLCQSQSWPVTTLQPVNQNELELRKVQCFQITPMDDSLITRYSSITKLQSVIAYCMRMKRKPQN